MVIINNKYFKKQRSKIMNKFKKEGVVTKEEFDRVVESLIIDVMNLKNALQEICPHKKVYRTDNYRYYTCMICGKVIFKGDLPEDCKRYNLISEEDNDEQLLTDKEYYKLKKMLKD